MTMPARKRASVKPGRDGDIVAQPIRFNATLLRPKAAAAPAVGEGAAGGRAKAGTRATQGAAGTADWTFLVLPKQASAKLPSRGQVSVAGTLNGFAFRATLEPDGDGGHWLRVDRKLREAAGAAGGSRVEAGDTVTLEIAPVAAADEPEPEVPPDFRKALAAVPGAGGVKAREVWADITPIARRDWVQWMTSGKKAETRVKRIETACDMLAKGKRRPCCFDRSGMYGKSLSCPVADTAATGTSRGTR